MEACGSSHHWARQISALGHNVRLIPANYARPYVKRGKSDAADAEAICEAVTRPTMRFVAIQSEEQQGVLFLHRARDLIVRQRTQLGNMLRGLLAEFRIVISQGIGSAVKFAKSVLDGDRPAIPEVAVDVLANLSKQIFALHLRVRWYEMRSDFRQNRTRAWHYFEQYRASTQSQRQRSQRLLEMRSSSEMVANWRRGSVDATQSI